MKVVLFCGGLGLRLRDADQIPKPMAIIADDDRMAVDLLIAAWSMGLRVPEDIAILGAEDLGLVQATLPIGLSSVDANFYEVGWRGAELLDRLDIKQATMVGHSTGGGEVVRYIARHGQKRVAKVVMVALTCLATSTAFDPGDW